jgi:phosphate transport system substrate-binding protein
MKKQNIIILGVVVVIALFFMLKPKGAPTSDLTGKVKVDGSSTVFPITEAVAEEFGKVNPGVRVTVGVSGTGGGFKKFCKDETDINDASRPIKDKEVKLCEPNNIGYIEIPVAFDGLSVVVNKDNDWIDYLTVDELNAIWKAGSTKRMWSDVRSGWPRKPIKLFGPGTDSGTFDYFKEAIIGKKNNIRADFDKSEDDNFLVNGVAGNKYAMAFFGYAYYKENSSKIRVVPIDGGSGPISPTEVTINDGTYAPLSRPIFIYVNSNSAEKTQVTAFIDYYIENAKNLVGEVGYIPLPDSDYDKASERFKNRMTGKWY